MTPPAKPTKLVIATPIDGLPESARCAYGYALAVAGLLAGDVDAKLVAPGLLGYPADLVRARSRAVRLARDAGATHVLWLDDDTVPKRGAVAAMLASGHDVVACPYPRKRIHWERMGHAMPGEDHEKHAYDYAFHLHGADGGTARLEVRNGCIAVDRMGMGCMLTSMRALDAMTEHFRDELWMVDVVEGRHYDLVALFQLVMTETTTYNGRPFRILLSEDYSFCDRYNRMREARPELGLGSPQMLVSHPADHVGGHLFKGAHEGLVYAR